jgi:peptidoglycan/xylan/chitin deacetylase (PgdA/CDA1 family)
MSGEIALTFDDGPSVWTEQILDILAEHEAHATFFIVGSTGAKRRDLLRRIADEGHELGNHTWSHPRLLRASADEDVRIELARTNELIADTIGADPVVYRVPHFEVDGRVDGIARSLGLRRIGADVTPADWHPTWSAKLTSTMVLGQARAGSIVCLHDGVPPSEPTVGVTRAGTVEAVAAFVPKLVEREFRFVAASAVASGAQA